VREKYGEDRVAQIITFGTLQARAVLRDVGRVLQMPYGQVDKLALQAGAVQSGQSGDAAEALEMEPKLEEARGDEQSRAVRHGAASSKGFIATPPPTPPASSSATVRWSSWCRSIAIRARTCRPPSST
jgi:DNA polymerase III alpha subunit